VGVGRGIYFDADLRITQISGAQVDFHSGDLLKVGTWVFKKYIFKHLSPALEAITQEKSTQALEISAIRALRVHIKDPHSKARHNFWRAGLGLYTPQTNSRIR
jgi:hypothetical protein